jgi:predicted dinucleotide-binding enzyme
LERAVGWLQLLARLPGRLDRLATQAERGALTVQTALAPDHAKALRRIERAVERQTWLTLAVGLLVAGALLRATPGSEGTGLALFIGAGLAFLWGLTRR